MDRNLLIHSMSEFSPITLAILEVINAKTVCEIGAEHGGNSKILNEWLQQRGGLLTSIDPKPSNEFLNWVPQTSIKHLAKPSHEAIGEVKTADAWFIDGDHNWYTVFNELTQIRKHAHENNHPILIFLHDVGWPWARRDLYYSPDSIPENFRHAYTWKEGVSLESTGVVKGGFRSHGQYAIALHEGGERNGVLTAIDDFVKLYPNEFCFANIPAVFGLGVLFEVTHPHANAIATMVAPFHENGLLKQLELNRLDNYLTVIRLQDEAQAAQAAAKTKTPAFQPAKQYEQFEKIAIQLATLLSNEHHQLNKIKSTLTDLQQRSELSAFTEYLTMLLNIPQENEAFKFLSILEAMCLLQAGEVEIAQAKLHRLAAQHPHCRVTQAIMARALQPA